MFLIDSFVKDFYLKQLNVEAALVAQKYPASGSFIDVSGFSKCGFVLMASANFTAGSAGHDMTLQVKQDTSATETADIKDIAGATLDIPSSGSGRNYFIEFEPAQMDINDDFRYVTLDISSASALGGDDYGALFFYGISDVKPATQPTGSGGYGDSVILAG